MYTHGLELRSPPRYCSPFPSEMPINFCSCPPPCQAKLLIYRGVGMTSADQGSSASRLNLRKALGPEKGCLGSCHTWWGSFLRGEVGGRPLRWLQPAVLLVPFSSASSCGSGTRFWLGYHSAASSWLSRCVGRELNTYWNETLSPVLSIAWCWNSYESRWKG